METLLSAAAQIIEAQGEDAMTTTSVAARAGYSVGTIYQYFPNRDAILVALIEKERQNFAESMRQALAKSDVAPSPETHRDLLRILIDVYARVPSARRRRLLIIWLQDTNAMTVLRTDYAQALAACWTRWHPADARRNTVRAFVLAQAVWGALHTAALTDARMLREPEFEDALMKIVEALHPRTS